MSRLSWRVCGQPILLSALVVFATPRAAHAAPESGFEHGLRIGAAMPSGDVVSGRSLSDDVDVRFPVWVDIGYRASPVAYFALYGQIGLTEAGDACRQRADDDQAVCNAEDIRLGLEALAHLTPGARYDWWIGAGLGWERMEQRALLSEPDANNRTQIVREYQQGPALELQAGLDLDVADALRAGPFLGYTLGSYLDEHRSCPEGLTCPGTGDTAIHHWFTLGMRDTFGP